MSNEVHTRSRIAVLHPRRLPSENVFKQLADEDPAVQERARGLLHRRFFPQAERLAIRDFHLLRFFFEEIVGLPFIHHTEEDFVAEAKVTLHTLLSKSNKPFTSTRLGLAIRRRLLRMVAADYQVPMSPLAMCVDSLQGLIAKPTKAGRSQAPALIAEDVIEELSLRPVNNALKLLRRRAHRAFPRSLEPGLSSPGDRLVAPDVRRLRETLERLLGTLKPKQERAIKGLFGLADGVERTLKEVGKVMGVGPERARQLGAAGMRRLRHDSRSRHIRPFMESFKTEDSFRVVTRPQRKTRQTLHDWQPRSPSTSSLPLTQAEEHRLVKWLAKLTPLQRQFLPEVLRGESTNIDLTNSDHVRAQASLLRKTRLALVTGALGRRPIPELIQALTRLAQERPMGRLMRWGVLHALLEVAGGDVDVLKDLILEMYPGEFSEDEVSRGLAGFTEVTAHIGNTRRGSASASAEDAVSALHGVIVSIGQERVDRRRLVMRRLYRDTFYRVMRRDEEIGSRRGLEALARAAEETHRSPSERGLLQETFEFYREARRFQPNGFREDTPHGREPLSPAQRYGIWAAVKSLQNPAETCALLTSEARIGKTIMAVLGAFNVRRADGVSAVQRVLYTTSNQAKYEVCDEIVRRTAFNIEVLVLDGTQEQKRETLRRAMSAPGNVVLLANYESVRDFTDEIQDFRPDAHIIDEINNLRRGDDTLRAPRIFGIRAPYRIGISAQLMVTRSEDVATTLSWARNRLYPTPASAERLRAEELYTALDPISVRWRRRIVLPELVHPQHEARFVEYDEAQDNVIRTMRQDFVRWRRFEARPDKASPADNLFVRFDMERRASVDLALVMPGDHWTHPSHKVRELDGIIDEEAATNGKVLVLVDFPELMDRLITRYNQRLGERAAFGISGKTPMSQRRDIVRKFRGDPQQAKVLFGTSFLLGASLNLSQLPGAPFRNATVVRLSRPWVNLDDGERLIDMKQAHPVRVITLISQFRARQGEPHLSTIEELQEKNLSGKRVLFKSVLDGNPVMSDEQVEALEAMADRASEGLKVTNQAR